MPISSTTNRKTYTGNGVTTVFPFAYYFLANTDLVVIKTEIATGAELPLALTTDYTVTGAGDESGGSVTLLSAPSSSYKITIYRDPTLTQEVDFTNNGPLPAAQLEQPVDKLTMIAQRFSEQLARAVRLSDGDVSGADVTLPAPDAGKGIRWNTAGDGLENYEFTIPTGAVVSATTADEGISKRASQAQVDGGTEAAAHVTPETLAASTLATRVSAAEVDINSLQAFNASDNLLINGGFTVDQRSATTGVADDAYCLDRWYALTQTGTLTVAKQSLQEAGTAANIRLTQAQASAQRIGLAQIVQNANSVFMRGRAIVLGARVRSSVAQTLRYAILEWTGSGDSVTSDVVNDWTSASYTTGNFFLASNLLVTAVGSLALSANAWTDLPALTGTISSELGVGRTQNLIAVFWSESTMAQNATLDIARAQLTAGTTLPEFKNEDLAITQMRCSKYYFSSFGPGVAPVQNVGTSPRPQLSATQVVGASTAQASGILVTYPFAGLRAAGTITLYNPFAADAQARNQTKGTSCSATSVANSFLEGCIVSFTSAAGSAAGDRIIIHLTADAEL